MVKHYNTSLAERAGRVFNTKGIDQFSDDVSSNLVAVVPVLPVTRIVRSNSRPTTGASTIFTTPTSKDFYLTGAMLTVAADAACDTTEQWLSVVIEGVTYRLLSVQKLTLTAVQEVVPMTFNPPIKVDRGVAISINQSFTVGAAQIGATIYGYTEEVTRT